MTIYHGTDEESAEKIKAEKILKGSNGPGIALTLERALEYAIAKCEKEGLPKYKGRIVVIDNIPGQILNTASKHLPEGFTLNDEFRNPSKGLHLQNVKTMTIKDAEHYAAIERNEFKTAV